MCTSQQIQCLNKAALSCVTVVRLYTYNKYTKETRERRVGKKYLDNIFGDKLSDFNFANTLSKITNKKLNIQ